MAEEPDSKTTPKDGHEPQALPTTRMGGRSDPQDELDPRVAELVEEYYELLVAGKAPSINDFVLQHPEHQTELLECLEGLQLVEAGQPTDPLTGKQIPKQLGGFLIVREVGRGGMGIVYEAQQIALKRRVALKILRYAVADQEAMLRFQREAETVARLHHSNIVPIFAVGEEHGVHYFAMQFIDGQSLDQLQREQQESLEPEKVVEWGYQVAEALAYAHENDIIHRDVKPSNLIRDRKGRIWLTDFGLAKRLDDLRLSMTGAVLGTPRYMSPEQASSVSQPVDHRTDIYSLGATLYELVTGQPLFNAQSPHAALGHIVSTEPTPPRAIRPSIPRDAETIILRCLSKDAGDRYDTARELASDLLAFTEGRPIKARRPSWVEQFGRWLQKNQRSVSIAASTAGLVAAVIFGSWFAVSRYRESQLGRIQFNTREMYSAPMVAELLKDDGSEAVSSFTVPTQQAIEIPKGDYDFRISVDGQPSSTSRLTVHPKSGRERVNVELPNRDVWPHVDIAGPWQLVDSKEGSDILVFDREGIALLDGETSTELWRTKFRKHELLTRQLKQADLDWEWKIHQYPDVSGSDQFAPARANATNEDWNDDGYDDLLLTMPDTPLLMAISSKDGELLWSTVVAFETDFKTSSEKFSKTLGEPLFVDVDEDGVLDVITHHLDVEASRQKERASYIVATAGTSGKLLWRYEFDSLQLGTTKEYRSAPRSVQWRGRGRQNEFESWNESGGRDVVRRWGSRSFSMSSNFILPHQPIILQNEGRSEIAVAAGDKLLKLNVGTGEPSSSHTLGFVPVCTPQSIDIDGDGKLELILCEQLSGQVVNGAFEKGSFFRTTCWKLSETRQPETPIWEHTLQADWNWLLPHSDSQQAWPLLEDLNGDGVAEIIVPGASTIDDQNFHVVPSGTLQVLDAKTGKPKWPDAYKVIHADGQLNHFVTTPDFNADGVRDIATVTLFQGNSTGILDGDLRTAYLHVEVLSGADGKRLTWIRSTPVTRPRADLPLVKKVSLQGDVLLVELQTDLKESPIGHLCLFSLSKGKEIIASRRVEQCRLTDLDGDEQPELVNWIQKSTFPPRGGRLQAWSLNDWNGKSRNTWSLTDQSLSPTGDIDGDGIDDASGGTDLNASGGKRFVSTVSGRTGKTIWRKSIDAPNEYRLSPLSIDADKDGCLDLLVGQSHRGHHLHTPLELWSGRTGQPLWRMKLDKPGAWSDDRVFEQDLDDDGQKELLVLAQTAYGHDSKTSRNQGHQQPLSLFCVNSNNGSVRWQTDILSGQLLGPAGYLQEGNRLISADVNSDDVRDVIGFSVDEQYGLAVRAWDGRNGKQLWDSDAGKLPDNVSMMEHEKYPSFVSLNDKNLSQIVFLSVANYASPTTRFDVIGVDAFSGMQDWNWSIKADDVSEPNKTSLHKPNALGVTKILKFRTAEGERVGFWYKVLKEDRVEFVLLAISNNAASPMLTKTLSLKSDAIDPDNWRSDYVRRMFVAPLDVNGDRLDELIYTTPTSLNAFSLADQRIVWEYPFELPSVQVASINQPGEPITITLSQGKTRYKHDQVVAVNGDGKKVWTAHTKEPVNIDEIDVLYSSLAALAPTVLLSNGKSTSGTGARIENSTNEWTLQKPHPALFDFRTLKTLPTGPDRLVEHLVHSLLISSLLIGLPVYYLGRLLKGRWSLRLLMLAPVVTGIVIVVAQFRPSLERDPTLTFLQYNALIAMNGLPLLVLLHTAYKLLRQGAWRGLMLLFIAVLGVGAMAYIFMMYVSGVFETAAVFGQSNEVRYIWSWENGVTIVVAGLGFVGMLLTLGYFVRFVRRVVQGTHVRLFRRKGAKTV